MGVTFRERNWVILPERRRPDVPEAHADDWDRMIGMWLHGRPESTCEIYQPEISKFGARVGWKPIGQITLEDLQNYAVELMPDQKPRTIRRKLATVKSLLTFCHRTGLIAFNPGAALRMPAAPNDLAEKILTEKQIKQLVASEPNSRNKVLLRVLYSAGIRASEAAGLCWVDVRARNERTGQITVLSKGAKTRTIKLPAKVWQALDAIRPKNAAPEEPVFQREDGGPMDRTYVTKIVARSARRANIPLRVSSHWLRHAHASHSLARGAPLVLIQRTLGHTSLDTTNRYLHISPEDSSSRYLMPDAHRHKRAVTKY
jgi:integrase/recombinase XerD